MGRDKTKCVYRNLNFTDFQCQKNGSNILNVNILYGYFYNK